MTDYFADTPASELPPQAIEAEQSVLSAMLQKGSAADDAIDILRFEDFYRPAHGAIFETMKLLRERGEPLDMVTLGAELTSQGILENVGGKNYLHFLRSFCPTTAWCASHARLVADKATLRRISEAGMNIRGIAYDPSCDLETVIALSEQALLEASEKRDAIEGVMIGDYAMTYMDKLYTRVESGGGLPGIPTGLTYLDNATNGLVDGDLIILGARPSMGKTATACVTIPLNLARQGKRVNIYSLDMNNESLYPRLLSSIAKVGITPILRAELSDDELRRLQDATDYFHRSPIRLIEETSLTVAQIRAHVRRTKPDFMVVDYLELITPEPGRREDRRLEIDRIAKGLKKIANDFKIPVMALSQLNRNVESRQDKRPMLSDLKESGGLEAGADLVLFLYRADYYDSEHKEKKEVEDLEIIIAKQRNGQTGRVTLGIRLQYSEVVTIAQESF